MSAWTAPKHAEVIGPHTDETPMHVTVVMPRHTSAPPLPDVGVGRVAVAHASFAHTFGASARATQQAHTFMAEHGLEHVATDAARRTVKMAGTPEALNKAFGVTLQCYCQDGEAFVAPDSAPQLPQGAIAVLGLDNRPVAKSYAKARAPGAFLPNQGMNSFTPPQLGEIYAFPPNTDGDGQCIAIIELGGGFTQDNLARYFQSLGITPPMVEAICVNGAQNVTGSDADGEVQLDIEVAGALAPKAKFVVYFTTNTDQGFYEAISQAAHDSVNKPSVMSISWGGPEDQWSPQAVQAIQSALEDAAALGVTITVASGDNGASDGLTDGVKHCDFPASSPSVLACGGTMLMTQGTHITRESVWNEPNEGATGGGVSVVFPLPAYQNAAGVPVNPRGKPGRGVPDVSGVADPVTGYNVLVNGEEQVVGGTSAVAPLWAALIARFNQALGEPVGELNSVLYAIPSVESVFHDISLGNNQGYSAHVGWDASTGLGSPNGVALLAVLQAMKTKNQKV